MKVLSLMKECERAEADGVKPAAKAVNTLGIVALLERHRVVLFFTGHAHAGKNMERVLAHRAKELQPAMQMCDALAANVAGEFKTILVNCLTHGRRQVADVAEQFPEAARHVIQALPRSTRTMRNAAKSRSHPSSACRCTRRTANPSWSSSRAG